MHYTQICVSLAVCLTFLSLLKVNNFETFTLWKFVQSVMAPSYFVLMFLSRLFFVFIKFSFTENVQSRIAYRVRSVCRWYTSQCRSLATACSAVRVRMGKRDVRWQSSTRQMSPGTCLPLAAWGRTCRVDERKRGSNGRRDSPGLVDRAASTTHTGGN